MTSIIQDWQFRTKRYENWQDNEIFCQGLRLGAKGEELVNLDHDQGEVIDLTGDDDISSTIFRELEWAAISDGNNDSDADTTIFKKEVIDDLDAILDDDEDARDHPGEKRESRDKIVLYHEMSEAPISGSPSTAPEQGANDRTVDSENQVSTQASTQEWVDWPLWTGM